MDTYTPIPLNTDNTTLLFRQIKSGKYNAYIYEFHLLQIDYFSSHVLHYLFSVHLKLNLFYNKPP